MIGYVFTDHLTWSWEDFSDSKVHHFSDADHRQAHIDSCQQDGAAHYPFYLTGNPHLVVLSDDLQAVYQERIATEGQDAANDFLKRTGRRLVADYDRWIKRDISGAAVEALDAAHQGPAVLFEWLMQQRRFTEAFDYAGRRIVKIRALPKGNRKRERSLPAWEDRARRAEWAVGQAGRESHCGLWKPPAEDAPVRILRPGDAGFPVELE